MTIGELTEAIAALSPPRLLVFDCDGVLAPLVDHADDAVLLEGIDDALQRLALTDGVDVAVLSGRSLAGLEQFGFPDNLIVVGSYGGERRGRPPRPLTATERRRLRELDSVARDSIDVGGDGSWIERKPTSVVIHVREADPERGLAALEAARLAYRTVPGAVAHEGSDVLELMARPADKGTALDRLRRDQAPGSVVYLGDDTPDEDAFARLEGADQAISIKVGPGETCASHRLDDPIAVRELINALVAALDSSN